MTDSLGRLKINTSKVECRHKGVHYLEMGEAEKPEKGRRKQK
jgi:hypothetical protein